MEDETAPKTLWTLIHYNSLLHLLQWLNLLPIMYWSFTKYYFTKHQRSSKCWLISLHNIQNHTVISPPIPPEKLNYLESVTRYKLNQASQNSFKKGSNFIICKSIVSCFPRSNRFTSFIFENISRFLMDNFDPCEHMQVSITSLQLILWRKTWDSVEEKVSYFSLQLHHRSAFPGVSHLIIRQKCPMHSLMLSQRILKCVLRWEKTTVSYTSD